MRFLLLASLFSFCHTLCLGQEVVAHRGASFDAPENTLAAFQLAWKQDADAIEGDFYLTADQEIVCIHDKDTARTAPGQPVREVAKSLLEDLKQLDVGSWKGQQYAGERIPTLEEVLSVVPKGKKILIEIKCGPEIVPVLKKQLAVSRLSQEQILIICFSDEVVRAVRESMPQYKANWLTSYRKSKNGNEWEPNLDMILSRLDRSKATGLGTQGRKEVIDKAFAEHIKKSGYELHVWTVNQPQDAQHFRDLHFQSITTDRPAFIRKALVQKAEPGSREGAVGTQYRIERQVVQSGYDGKHCWVHARAGVVRDESDLVNKVVMTSQKLDVKGSDTFSAISSSSSFDAGETWSALANQPGFERWELGEGMEETICDFTPAWHAASKTLLGTGQSVRYKEGRVMKVRPRYTAYSTYDSDADVWGVPKRLVMPDALRFANCGAGSVQRYDEKDGTILLPVYFKEPAESDYSVTVCRCSFDGKELRYLQHGDELTVTGGRGLYEPSITKFGDRYFLTLRNDKTGYVCTSTDGLHFNRPQPWKFDDGENLGNYNTQQHWAQHGDHLYLIYTRRGANNDHVFRHRAPLFMGEVSIDSLSVNRDTEVILVPERGARLGNFGVMNLSETTTWVVVTEWMQTWHQSSVILPVDNPYGADNSIFVAKIHWNH